MANIIDQLISIGNGTYGDKYGYNNGSVLGDVAAIVDSTFKPASDTNAAKVLTPETNTANANDWGPINVPTGPSAHSDSSHSSTSPSSGSGSGSGGTVAPGTRTPPTATGSTGNSDGASAPSTGGDTPTTPTTPANTWYYGGSSSNKKDELLEKVDPSKSVDYSQRDASYGAYLSAMQSLANQAGAPNYDPQYTDTINSLVDQITNRSGFQYNLNDDQLYQQYRDKYLANGRLSMMDTMGQAAGLTGGYGSSYGQMVGQQAYDAQLQQLNDIVPELYDRAYQRYQDEGNRMDNLLGLYRDLDNTDYGRYQDQLDQWNRDRNYLTGERDSAYDRYNNERNAALVMEDRLMAERNANLLVLMDLVKNGYEATPQDIADAGITPEQWVYYKKMAKKSGSSGAGAAGTRTTGGTLTTQDIYDSYNSGDSVTQISDAIAGSGMSDADQAALQYYLEQLNSYRTR